MSVAPGADLRSSVELDWRAREIVAALKYRRERRLAEFVAQALAAITPAGADLLTWVPATPARVRRRGFDQAEEIANAVAKLTAIPIRRSLRRGRRDSRQTERTRVERAAGPDLSHVPEASSSGLVVVIDDVVTTGATLGVCRRVLVAAGASRVVGVTFAATPKRKSYRNR